MTADVGTVPGPAAEGPWKKLLGHWVNSHKIARHRMGFGACKTVNWDDLKCFIAVAQSGSLTDAGAMLKLSASTVARRIAALEQALGRTLFVKKTNGYFLSEAGAALVPLALETEERFRLIERQLAQPGAGLAGQVRIDCPELMGTHLIIPGLDEFRQQYPQISFDFSNSASSAKLTQSHSDVIVRLHRPDQGNFTLRRVGWLAQGLFCSPAYAARHGVPGSAAELAQHSLIGWSTAMAHMPLAQWLEQISGGQTPWMRTANLTAQLKAVQANLGIAALPAYVGQGEGLHPVLDDLPPQGADIWLLRNQATQGLERVDRVVEHLVAQFQRCLAPRP